MKEVSLAAITLLILAACNSARIPVERMSEAELFAYNDTQEFWDQVYCTDDVRTGSHIRKRVCATLAELQDYNENQIGFLSVISSGRSLFE